MKTESRIPDHCIKYGLSDPKDTAFQAECSYHLPNLHCQNCERTVFLRDGTEEDNHKKDTLLYLIDSASDNINEWQKHILRSVNQEKAKLELLKRLDGETVLLIGDFAMKMLPFSGRMSQRDWFGLKGR